MKTMDALLSIDFMHTSASTHRPKSTEYIPYTPSAEKHLSASSTASSASSMTLIPDRDTSITTTTTTTTPNICDEIILDEAQRSSREEKRINFEKLMDSGHTRKVSLVRNPLYKRASGEMTFAQPRDGEGAAREGSSRLAFFLKTTGPEDFSAGPPKQVKKRISGSLARKNLEFEMDLDGDGSAGDRPEDVDTDMAEEAADLGGDRLPNLDGDRLPSYEIISKLVRPKLVRERRSQTRSSFGTYKRMKMMPFMEETIHEAKPLEFS